MKNPARELHELINDWVEWRQRYSDSAIKAALAPPAAAAVEVRKRWLARHYAINLVQEVDRALTGMENAELDVAIYRKFVSGWYSIVFDLLQKPFSGADELPRTEMQMLEALASHLDSVQVGWEANEVDYNALLEALDKAQKLLDECPLPANEDRYVRALITEAREVVSEVRKFGSATARKLTAELGGEILRLTAQIPQQDQQKRWWAVLTTILGFAIPKFAGKAIEAAGTDAGQGAIQAITGGNAG